MSNNTNLANSGEKKYSYKGALEPVHVKVITFHSMPDYIFSLQQWQNEGGWKGIVKTGAFALIDVKKVITGTMCPIKFANLQAWEG